MQENTLSHARELICINVEKVYDWVMKELSFEFSPKNPIFFKGLPGHVSDHDLRDARVTCQVRPDEENAVVILKRENRRFTVDGESVTLQQLTIKKNFIVTICLTLTNGMTHNSEEIKISRIEHVVLCAPKGTNIDVTYTDLDCFVSSTGAITRKEGHGHGHDKDKDKDKDHDHGHGHGHGHFVNFENLSISVSICQSIQSTFPVTVEFLADYCEPRSELSLSSCSPTGRPGNCSVVFP